MEAKTKLARELAAGDVLLPGQETVITVKQDDTGRGLDVAVQPPGERRRVVVWWVPLRHPFIIA
jgi:hypothetical protein